MTDIETETEKWEGQVSDEWRRDTIYWLRATPNEDIQEWVSIKRTTHEQYDNEKVLEVLDELEELIEDE